MDTGDIMLGVTDGLACCPDGGWGWGVAKLGICYKLRPFGPFARVRLYLFTWSYFSSKSICSLTQGTRKSFKNTDTQLVAALGLATFAIYFPRV